MTHLSLRVAPILGDPLLLNLIHFEDNISYMDD